MCMQFADNSIKQIEQLNCANITLSKIMGKISIFDENNFFINMAILHAL